MKLLYVTDHRFTLTSRGVGDTYCFGNDYFRDYLSVFEEVVIAARARADEPSGGVLPLDAPRVSFRSLGDLRGWRWMRGARAAIRELFRSDSFDAVICRLPGAAPFEASTLARESGVPFMFELCGDASASLPFTPRAPWRFLYGQLDASRVRRAVAHATCGSYVSRSHLQIRYPSASRSESISSLRLPAAAIREPRVRNRAGSSARLVTIGSLLPVKRHDVTIRALAHLRERGVPAHLSIIGSGPELSRLISLSARHGVRDHVDFPGQLPGLDSFVEILDASDLFILSSDSEGMPRAMIEAAARGLPCIGACAGGIAELLPPSQQYRRGDAREAALIAQELLTDPMRWNEASAASIALASGFVDDSLSARRVELLRHFRGRVERGAA